MIWPQSMHFDAVLLNYLIRVVFLLEDPSLLFYFFMSDKESLSQRASRISNYTETSIESAKKYITKGILDDAEHKYHQYKLRPVYPWFDQYEGKIRFMELDTDEIDEVIKWLKDEGFDVSEMKIGWLDKNFWNVSWK
jgi:hypothetical protein